MMDEKAGDGHRLVCVFMATTRGSFSSSQRPLAAPKNLQFAAGIGSILLVFIGSNFFYARYLQHLAFRSRIVN